MLLYKDKKISVQQFLNNIVFGAKIPSHKDLAYVPWELQIKLSTICACLVSLSIVSSSIAKETNV